MNSLTGQVEVDDVIVHDEVRRKSWKNYFEIKILNNITPDTITQEIGHGLRIWHHNNSQVFVSDDLKEHILKISNEFEFSEGFSLFA
jgi:hypothetical protein